MMQYRDFSCTSGEDFEVSKRSKIAISEEIMSKTWATREEFFTDIINGRFGVEEGYSLSRDTSLTFRGSRCARVYCNNCQSFFVVARFRKTESCFIITESFLKHESILTLSDGAVARCPPRSLLR